MLIIGGFLLSTTATVAQEQQPRQLKGGGHRLGETTEQFFSLSLVGELVRACEGKDWKTVKSMAKSLDPESKVNTKQICDRVVLIKHEATRGARQEYDDGGDYHMMRRDTFTLDSGYLVKIRMVYSTPIGNIEGFHPKSFDELFMGLREAYGEPTKSFSETVVNSYGIRREAHRALWLGKENVISIAELSSEQGSTEITAETLAEYQRDAQAAKPANPLQ